MVFSSIFAATMDNRVRSLSKTLTENLFDNPEEYIESVVKSLTANVSGTSAKVKILHDWICDNIAYDTDLYFTDDDEYWNSAKQDYVTVIKKRRALCSGYSNVMTVMCRLAGIEAKGVSGWSKGFAYQGHLTEQTNHAWNVVNIGGRWQQIDVTWDAGYVEYKTFIKRYTTEWLYRTPEQFIYSHFPKDEQYQYLKEKKTPQEFEKEPYVPGKFFDYGFSFTDVKPDYSNEISEATRYEFKIAKTGIVTTGSLYEKSSGYNKQSCWTDRIFNRVAVDFALPQAKTYRAMIMAFNQSEHKMPEFYGIDEFENSILPKAAQLVANKKITQRDYENLQDAYFKVEQNGRYYAQDIQFASARTASALKTLKLLEQNTQEYENILYFDLKPSQNYKEFVAKNRYPQTYSSYIDVRNTLLLSPRQGALKKGETVNFLIDSKDFSSMALYINEKLILLKKNQKGIFELETEIPDTQAVKVCGSKPNAKSYLVLWEYEVR